MHSKKTYLVSKLHSPNCVPYLLTELWVCFFLVNDFIQTISKLCIYKLISNEMKRLKAILGIKMIEIMEDSTNIYPE